MTPTLSTFINHLRHNVAQYIDVASTLEIEGVLASIQLMNVRDLDCVERALFDVVYARNQIDMHERLCKEAERHFRDVATDLHSRLSV